MITKATEISLVVLEANGVFDRELPESIEFISEETATRELDLNKFPNILKKLKNLRHGDRITTAAGIDLPYKYVCLDRAIAIYHNDMIYFFRIADGKRQFSKFNVDEITVLFKHFVKDRKF